MIIVQNIEKELQVSFPFPTGNHLAFLNVFIFCAGWFKVRNYCACFILIVVYKGQSVHGRGCQYIHIYQ
jgi:hypothetical protein